MSVMPPKCYLRHKFFVCKARYEGQRRYSDSSGQNRLGFFRGRNNQNEERVGSDKFDESEFLPTKNGPLGPNTEKYDTTASGARDKEIVEIFKRVQLRLREKAGVEAEERSEVGKEHDKKSEEPDPILRFVRKLSVEPGKRKVNGGFSNKLNFDRTNPQQSGKSNEEKSEGFSEFISIVREGPRETKRSSFSRPLSNFRRRSPVPRIRYEPIVSAEDSVSHSGLDEKSGEIYSEPASESESESDIEPDTDLSSRLELDQEEDEVEELETAVQSEIDLVNGHAAEFSDAEEDNVDERETEKQLTALEDFNVMKLAELRALAKARGMKGYSKLKKSELVGLLSEDAI